MGRDWWTPEAIDAPTRGPAERKAPANVTPENRTRILAAIDSARKQGKAGVQVDIRAAHVAMTSDERYLTCPSVDLARDPVGSWARWLRSHPQGFHVAYRGVNRKATNDKGERIPPSAQATARIAFLAGDYRASVPRAKKEKPAAEAAKAHPKK